MADYQGYGGYGAPQTPQAARMALANAMMQHGASTGPIDSPWQGVNQLAQALTARGMMGQIGAGQQAAAGRGADLLTGQAAQMLGVPGTGAAATAGPAQPPIQAPGGAPSGGPFPQSAASSAADDGGVQNLIGALKANIAKMESGGNYGAVGPQTKTGDQAYGKYQVMGANVGPWTKEALGYSETPQQFLHDQGAQEGVASYEFQKLLKQGYSPQDVASMWFTGKPLAQGAGLKDVNGMSGARYAANATQGLPAPGGGTSWGDVQRDNAQGMDSINAYSGEKSPALAAINSAAPQGAPQGSPQSPQVAQMGGGQAVVDRIRQLALLAQDQNATAETRALAGQMLQAQMQLVGPHPFSWSNVPGTNDQRQMDWLGNPTGRTIQGGPMKMGDGDQLYSVPPNDPTHPNIIGSGMSPPPNTPAAGGPAPPGATPAAPQPLPSASAPAPQPAAPMQTAPAPASQPPASATSPNGLDPLAGVRVPGEDYLDRVQSDPVWGPYASQARAILRSQVPYPTGNVAGKGVDQHIIRLVQAADPNFNANVSAAKADAIKQFADRTSPGAPGGMVLAANKALHHLAALADTSKQLNNGGIPVANWIGNEARDWTVGNPALKAFEFNRNALVDEIAKIYKGGTPAEAEIHAMAKSITPSMTPAEQQEVFVKISTLLQGATGELQRQWHTLYGSNAADYPVLGDESQKIIQRFGGGQSVEAPAGAPQGARKAPDGHFYAPDPARPGKYLRLD